MPLRTFISTFTVSLAATTSSSIAHSLSASPDYVWATQKHTVANITNTNYPVFCAGDRTVGCNAHTQSVTVYNKGQIAGTWTVAVARFHSIIR
jgi:hypothetical protein